VEVDLRDGGLIQPTGIKLAELEIVHCRPGPFESLLRLISAFEEVKKLVICRGIHVPGRHGGIAEHWKWPSGLARLEYLELGEDMETWKLLNLMAMSAKFVPPVKVVLSCVAMREDVRSFGRLMERHGAGFQHLSIGSNEKMLPVPSIPGEQLQLVSVEKRLMLTDVLPIHIGTGVSLAPCVSLKSLELLGIRLSPMPHLNGDNPWYFHLLSTLPTSASKITLHLNLMSEDGLSDFNWEGFQKLRSSAPGLQEVKPIRFAVLLNNPQFPDVDFDVIVRSRLLGRPGTAGILFTRHFVDEWGDVVVEADDETSSQHRYTGVIEH